MHDAFIASSQSEALLNAAVQLMSAGAAYPTGWHDLAQDRGLWREFAQWAVFSEDA